eukprot:SAG31_NODE_22791_length_517_cov_2.971292_2_plen_33_part_01
MTEHGTALANQKAAHVSAISASSADEQALMAEH